MDTSERRVRPFVVVALVLALIAVSVVGGSEITRLSGELTELRSAHADTNDEVERVERIADKTRANLAASKPMNVKATYAIAIASIVTVHCGESLGSGFAYDVAAADGYNSVIVTNHHVIEDCTWNDGPPVSIETNAGDIPESKLWNWDKDNDMALIMTTAALNPLVAADEGEIGDSVIAIGSPQGFTGSVTRGIVSNVYADAYQTDAAINHGNSGGPLLDTRGRVLGVTTLGIDREGLNIAFRTSILCDSLLACP